MKRKEIEDTINKALMENFITKKYYVRLDFVIEFDCLGFKNEAAG